MLALDLRRTEADLPSRQEPKLKQLGRRAMCRLRAVMVSGKKITVQAHRPALNVEGRGKIENVLAQQCGRWRPQRPLAWWRAGPVWRHAGLRGAACAATRLIQRRLRPMEAAGGGPWSISSSSAARLLRKSTSQRTMVPAKAAQPTE